MSNLLQHSANRAGRAVAGYAPGQNRPLRGYAGTMATYGAVTAALGGLAQRQGRAVPRASASDIVLIACATHKVARLLAKDAVTSPIRAPFTRFSGPAGDGELAEEVRGAGVKHAIGELITCPFCLAQWVATSLIFGLVFAPRVTRLAATTMTAVAGSDFLQLAYAWAQHKAEG
jgi:hypothetical protein